MPESTRRAYAGDLDRFAAWCASTGRAALPASAETLTEYATHLAYTLGRRPATVDRALSAIRVGHRAAGVVVPELVGARLVLRGYAAQLVDDGDARARPRRAAAADLGVLRALVGTVDRATLAGCRDAALLLLGFALAGRRSELIALDLGDVAETGEGLDVAVYRGKRRARQQVAVPYGSRPETCPVRAVRTWRERLAEHGRHGGPLFVRVDRHDRPGVALTRAGRVIGDPDGRMTGEAVADVVERAATRAGLAAVPEGAEVGPRWTAHALRRGFATAARRAGHDLVLIGRHGGWADGSRSLLGYLEDADRWTDNPLHGMGL